MNKKTLRIVPFLVVVFMFASIQEAKAWRLFGWETHHEPSTSANGKCYDHQTSDYYFLGINFGGSRNGDGYNEVPCNN